MKKIIFFGVTFLVAYLFFSKNKDQGQISPKLESPLEKRTPRHSKKTNTPEEAFHKHIEVSKKKIKKIVENSSLSEQELDLLSNFKIKSRDIINSTKKNQQKFLRALAKGGASLKECLKEDLCGTRDEFEEEEYFDENNTYYHNQLQRMLESARYASNTDDIKDAFSVEALIEYVSSPGSNLLIKEAALDLMIKTDVDSEIILKQKDLFSDGSFARFYQKLLKKDFAIAKESFIEALNSSDMNDTKDLLGILNQLQLSEQEIRQSVLNLCRFSHHPMHWPVIERPLSLEIKRQAYILDPKQICE